MRTNVVLDDKLMKKAMDAAGLDTKKATIEAGLKLLIDIHKQTSIRAFRGKLQWTGDLEKMRKD